MWKLLALILKELTEMINFVILMFFQETFHCTNNFTSIDVCENQTTMSILSTAVISSKETEKRRHSVLYY